MAPPMIGHASYRVRQAATMVHPAARRTGTTSDSAHSARCNTTRLDNANSSGSVIGVLCR